MSSETPSILRLPDVMRRLGLSRSSVYSRVSQGALPPPVRISRRCTGWPSTEIDRIIAACVRGIDEAGLRLLVGDLVAERGGAQ